MQLFLVEMEINMIEKGKKLTLSQRIKIEEMLNQRCRKYEIAKKLDKSPSTISREINRHHIVKPHNAFKNAEYFSQYFAKTEIEILVLVIIVQN